MLLKKKDLLPKKVFSEVTKKGNCTQADYYSFIYGCIVDPN